MSSSPAVNLCFNSNCKHVVERPRKGWRRRSGDFSDLCDRCASVYEEGKFCETFHINSSGWRCCESCGKQIHCGCIVSFHMFVLLDAGGIECITCARKSFILTPNPAWPPPSLFLPLHSEGTKDLAGKNWCHMAGSGPVPWRHAPSFFSSSFAQPDLQPRFDITDGVHNLTCSERLSVASFDKKKLEVPERLINGSLKLVSSEKHDIGNPGINCTELAKLHVNISQQPSFLKKETSPINFPLSSVMRNEMKDSAVVSCTHVSQPIPSRANGKHCSGQHGTESSGEVQTHNGWLSGDNRLLNQSFPCNWPKISDHELQEISGTSKSVITPLFEKTLSVSDAGNLGRLVLPKKYAEAYFPPISKTEGLPLNVHDLKGKEWTFQFRFWPNNNSRMYVLEGVNPCIQSMNLQAGDVVTFNRGEPEGKLVMGFRKASAASPSNQDARFGNASNRGSTIGDCSAKKSKHGEGSSKYLGSVRPANVSDQASSQCKGKKAECTVKEVLGAKSATRNKRKNSTLGLKSKHLKLEKDDLIELELTLEQAQGLVRPPLNRIPSVVVIEGLEFEEYEDAPVIGRPTIIAIDSNGENIQWAQCEDCLKWRKVPGYALLSSRWTCSQNSWDPERSSCSMAQELTTEQLEELLPRSKQTDLENTNAVKQEPDSLADLDGLNGIAYPAIQDEGDANLSSQATPKHPCHRPGCSCIVCIQPSRGEGPRHVQTCTCIVCLSLKRRLQTLMTRHEKRQSEKDAECLGQKLPDKENSPKQVSDVKKQACLDIGSSNLYQKMANDSDTTRSSLLPVKGQIDLNIRPERDEEQSPGSDSGGLMKLIQDTTERYLRQQMQSSSSNSNLSGNFRSGNGRENGNEFLINHGGSEAVVPLPVSDKTPVSTSDTQR